MARRVVYGLSYSENGWPMVDTGSCSWTSVPGTPVTLQIQQGAPLTILRAFAADFNAFVEPLRDADSACWTATNSVASSNHLSGTGMDLNWNGADGRTFRYGISEARAYPGDKAAKLRALLDWYEDIVFCGGKWTILDWMHFQLNGSTWDRVNNRPMPRTTSFIERKIRPDGYSTYQRGAMPLSRADRYAQIIIGVGRRLGVTDRGITIALAVALVESNLTNYANSNDPASLKLPHDAVGSDHLSSGVFQQQPWWGELACRMDVACSAELFFTCDKGPGTRGLLKIPYDYNNMSRTPGFYAQTVQGSKFPDRYDQRYPEAERLFARLSALDEGDDMAQVPQDQWNQLFEAVCGARRSQSLLRHLGEGRRWMATQLTENDDGMLHPMWLWFLGRLGQPQALAELRDLAAADLTQFPDRRDSKELAQAILADITTTPETAAVAAAPQMVYQQPIVAAPVATAVPAATTAGQIIGQAYDALEALQLSGVLTDAEKAPLAALISVLSTKTGVTE